MKKFPSEDFKLQSERMKWRGLSGNQNPNDFDGKRNGNVKISKLVLPYLYSIRKGERRSTK